MATFPHHYKIINPKCVISINGESYDVSNWRCQHPGGAETLDNFHNKDATDAFYALHSKEAIQRLKRLSKKTTDFKAENIEQPSKVALAFRDFRKKLEEEGWFKRNWAIDLIYVLQIVIIAAFATIYSKEYPFISAFILGLIMQQTGWLSHDHLHGKGKFCAIVSRIMSGIILGFSAKWWNHKHNIHHIFPNRLNVDVDIHNEPLIHLWFPKPDSDVWYRKYQHIYYLFLYSFLHYSWRIQSLTFALGSRDTMELFFISLGFIWLGFFPIYVPILAIFIAGFATALVVTCNHQSEEIIQKDAPYCFVVDNFKSTRGVVCDNFITEYLFGGMQYQLEHHLFPFMPRYYYPKLRPILKKFSEENDLPFKLSGVFEILKLNYQIMKKYSISLQRS